MKEEMEAQQLGYKLWTIDTSKDQKHLWFQRNIYSTPRPEDGSVHRNLLKNQGAKDRDLNLPLFLVFASEVSQGLQCWRQNLALARRAGMMPRAISMRFVFVHLFPHWKGFSMPQIFGYPGCCIIAPSPVDLWQELTSMLEVPVPKLAMGYIDPSWFQVVFEVFKSWGFEAARPTGHFDSDPKHVCRGRQKSHVKRCLEGFSNWECVVGWDSRRKTGSGCGLDETKGPGIASLVAD